MEHIPKHTALMASSVYGIYNDHYSVEELVGGTRHHLRHTHEGLAYLLEGFPNLARNKYCRTLLYDADL